MAAESNAGFHRDDSLGSALNRHAISFRSGAINSMSEMIPMGNYFGMNNAACMMFSGNSSIMNNSTCGQVGNSSASLLLDSVTGLKHDAGLAVEWSVEEQFLLEEGLDKFADEPSIMRYIKIAATLGDKTVRDVALRCRWMTRKRRKAEEHNIGKKLQNRKDKLVESSSKMNTSSAEPVNMAPYSLLVPHFDQNGCRPCEGINGAAKHLLEQNSLAFNQITNNLSTYKLQDNIDLFCRTRKNITAILNNMRDMHGMMSHMPPLPVSLDEDLANSILSNTT